MNERRLHQAFEISVLLKGAHALIETIGGLALFFVANDFIRRLVRMATQQELSEDPADFIATHALHLALGFSIETQQFYALYLLSYGVVKLALVVGLLSGKLWAYPASLAVLAIFVAYQIYRFATHGGIGLIILTLFDILVAGLVWHEYRLVRRHGLATGSSACLIGGGAVWVPSRRRRLATLRSRPSRPAPCRSSSHRRDEPSRRP